VGLLQTKFENPWVTVTNHVCLPCTILGSGPIGRQGQGSRIYFDQVGYFLSPLDFLNECLTFFLFRAAFKRLVFFRLFMFSSVRTLTPSFPLKGEEKGEGLFDQPDS
jgi:hypothetical protein